MKKYLFTTFLILLILPSVFGQYRIAYNVAQDSQNDDYEVYSMNTDGSDKRNITNNKDVAWSYYAYKNRLFFVSDRDACKRCYALYEMDAFGKNVKKLSDLRLEDSWMGSRNDGSEMVVSGRIGTDIRYQLFIIDLKTGKYKQITDEKEALFRDPSFSPDGKQIICAYKKQRANREEYEDLYIMNADGSNRRRLTTYPKDDKTSEWHNYHAGSPRWVKKHNFITYHSVQNGKSSLYAVTPDGKKNWKLTDNKMGESFHDWSPDGKWLAIDMFEKDEKEIGVYLMNWKTKEVKLLTDAKDFKYQQSPAFVENTPQIVTKTNELDSTKKFIEAFNLQNIDAMLALTNEDVKWFSVAGEKLTTETSNKAELKTFLEGYFKSCPTCRSKITNVNQHGNRVTMTETATWETEKGKQSNNSFAVYEFSDGKIARVYYYGEPAKSSYDAVLAKKLGADERGMKTFVFVNLIRGKKQFEKAERDKLVAGHIENIGKLAETGKLVLAGPFFDDNDIRGIYVFDVDTLEKAKALVETDPAVKAGVFEFEMRLWYGSAALLELGKIHNSIRKSSITK